MLTEVARYELRGRVRRGSTLIYFGLFFALGFLFMNVSAGAFKQVSTSFGGKVLANAPLALHLSISLLSYFAVLITAAVMGDAVYKDIEHGVEPMLFTTRLTRADYVFGRYLGALAYLLLVNVSIGLGLWAATFMPWLEPTRLGPNRVAAYLLPYATVVLPNLVVTGAFFFSLAARLRRILPVYMAGVLLLIGYLIAAGLTSDLDTRVIASLFDPFGLTSVGRLTEYWTVSERNSRLVPLAGVFLANRALWLAAGLVALAVCYGRFTFSAPETKRATPAEGARPAPGELHLGVRSELSPGAWLRLLPRLVRRELRETVRNVYFVVILFAGLLFLFFASTQLGSLYGTPTYPMTYAIVELTAGSFSLFILIILTFYSGEILHRDRELGISDVLDASPVPTALLHAAKAGALAAVAFILLAVVLLSGVLI